MDNSTIIINKETKVKRTKASKNNLTRTDKLMKKRTPKQIAALLCVVLLVSIYIITLIVAFLDLADAGRLFSLCLIATIGLPILLWIFLWFYGLMKERQTEALEDLKNTDSHNEHSQRYSA